MKELIEILKYKLLWLNILFCVIFGVASFYYAPLASLFFILLSNLFDVLGYHFSLIRRSDKLPEKIIVHSYRINQFLFDLLLLILVALQFGYAESISGWVLKLFGLQDIFYYIFLQTPLPLSWNWMKWTPLGFIKGVLNRKEIIIQAFVGIIISVLLFVFIK